MLLFLHFSSLTRYFVASKRTQELLPILGHPSCCLPYCDTKSWGAHLSLWKTFSLKLDPFPPLIFPRDFTYLFSNMEDTPSLPVRLPDTPNNNLLNINTAFQDHCLPTLLSTINPCMVLCDFPSRIPYPPPHISIYGLEDFSIFLNAAISQHQSDIYILTQSIYHLRKLLFKPCPLTQPFTFFTRTSNSAPGELKIIEIFNSLPNDTFGKITSLEYLLTFPASLNGKKGPWTKHFDLFQMTLDSRAATSSIQLPTPNLLLHGIMFDECVDNIASASEALAQQNIPHLRQNTIQAKPPSHIETICYKIPITDSENLTTVLNTLDTFTSIHAFNFSAILAASLHSSCGSAINFIPTRLLQSGPLIEVFEHCKIPYLPTHSFLVFIATPTKVEEAILAALDLNVTIPPSFLSAGKRLIFQQVDDSLTARLLPLCDSGVIELQIARIDPCTLSEVYFETSFLNFIKSRFHIINQPQLCIVRDHAGEIREVLSLTSSTDLFNTITRDSLPLLFVHNGTQFALSFLQPLFQAKPRPITNYPFETQAEHFQRFQNTSDSLAARIPWLTPHQQHGGPLANEIITSLSPSFFGDPERPSVFLFSPPPSGFYIIISPFENNIPHFLPDLFPNTNLSIHTIPFHELSFRSPHFVLFDIPPRQPFHLPHLLLSPPKLSSAGWITILPFSACKIIFLVQSPEHLSVLSKYLTKLFNDQSFTIVIGIPTPTIISIDPNPTADTNEDIIMEEEIPNTPEDPTSLPHSHLLLMCYRLLSYFSWSKDFDHPRQRLLNCVAGGLHLADPLIIPFLSAALNTFADDYFSPPLTTLSLFNKLSLGLPESVLNALFPTTLPNQPTQILYLIPIPSFPHSTDIDQLKLYFSQIFDYMPPGLAISLTQSTLLFSSENLALLHLPILAELLSSTFTITSASRKRTSEAKRPLVLKLMSIVIEPDAPDQNGHLPPLTIEKYDPDSCSVTVYDPYKGLYTMPLSNLVSYNIISLILKRTSQKTLICPKLIQQFCALSIKPPTPSSPSSFSIISLFDGSGSFTDVIANALQQWPHAILAAEMDADTRSVVSRVKGWPAHGSVWAFDKKGAHTFYAKDVWDLIQDYCFLLRQFLSLLPPDCVIFVGAGSPCQDLTSIGRGKGVLRLTGDRSVHIHCVWAVLYFLPFTPFWVRTVILVENAGSMRSHMKSYILSLLGIPSSFVTTLIALAGAL